MQESIKDIGIEALAIGMIYNHPELIDEYVDSINPKTDFTEASIKEFYEILIQTYFSYETLTETSLNVYISTMDKTQLEAFNDLGGISALKRMAKIAENTTDNFLKIYSRLKTYSTVRQLSKLNVTDNIDKFLAHDAEWALRQFDLGLNKIGNTLSKISEPENLKKGIKDYLQQLAEKGDVGIGLPYKQLDNAFRGLRKGTLSAIAFPSNSGKSRFCMDILSHTSVIGDTKSTLISTEQYANEIQLMLATNIANKVFGDKYKTTIDESSIALNTITDIQHQMLDDSADYIEKNCKINFKCCNSYTFDVLKRIIKSQAMMGSEIIIIDVLKSDRQSTDRKDLQEWALIALTGELLKRLAMELGISIIITLQLKPEAIANRELEINSIALATHIYFILDHCLAGRPIGYDEIDQYGYYLNEDGEAFGGGFKTLDPNGSYFIIKTLKNRAGAAGINYIYEFDRGTMMVHELGQMKRIKNR